MIAPDLIRIEVAAAIPIWLGDLDVNEAEELCEEGSKRSVGV